jgi:hypothetical protein
MMDQDWPGNDIIDLRDVISRRDDILATPEADRDDTDSEYLEAVIDLAAQLSTFETAADNEPVMILDSYFTEYAQQLAEDLGLVEDTAEWPCCCIDWERAARELQQDYTTVTFGGHTYHTRAW